MCDDVDGDANTSADVELEVNRPPVILDSSSPTLVNAREGQSSKLECYADGFPEPRVTWTRQNNGIITSGGNYQRYQHSKITPQKNLNSVHRLIIYINKYKFRFSEGTSYVFLT